MGVVLAESYVELIRDPAHWAFELTLEALTGVALSPFLRRRFRRWRDREHARIDAEHGITREMHENPMHYVEDGQERVPEEVFVK